MSVWKKFCAYMKFNDEDEEDYSSDTHYPKKGTVMDHFLEYVDKHRLLEDEELPCHYEINDSVSPYEVDFNSFKELPECKLLTLIYRVISFDGHETGVSVIVIPSRDHIQVVGNDFGRLTNDNRNYLKQQMKDFCKAHNEY